MLHCSPFKESCMPHQDRIPSQALARLREQLQARDYAAAAALAENFTAAHPQESLGWLMLTEARRGLGEPAAALDAARRLVALVPEEAWAHQLHALLAKRQQAYPEAEAAYRRALELAPDDAESHCNLAAVLSATQRHEEALKHLRRAIALKPEFAEAHTNLGAILVTVEQDLEGGLAACQRAVELNPQSAIAHDNLGVALSRQDRLAEAMQAYRQAVVLNPRLALAHYHLGELLLSTGAYDEAEVAMRQVLRVDPQHQQAQDRLLSMQAFLGTAPPAVLRRESERWERALLSEPERQAAREQRFERRPRNGRKLRLGLLSAEFGQHPVAYFLLSWLRALDRSRFTLYLYATNTRSEEPGNAEFRALADHWLLLSDLDDTQAARQLRQDQLDLLIETSGHTDGNRLGIIARRVAPVQCHYIGYYATTGLSEMDYFLGDPVLIPPAQDTHFTEQVWRLPRTRYAYQPLDEAPAPHWHPAADGRLRLGSFNSFVKIRRTSLVLWARVLQALPEARLVLKSSGGESQDTGQRILAVLQRQGIAPDRIELLPRAKSWAEHMALYNDIDIALDSIPFNSATTAFDALWMGTPLLSLLGDRLAGRQAASCLTGLGRSEWIAESEAAYVDKVVALARDPEQRRQIRETQRARMRDSELCDGPGLARALEQAFEAMFERWFAKQYE
jgi:predicted O-linked N-acetylglucosamine transferase (SPINDLY family)